MAVHRRPATIHTLRCQLLETLLRYCCAYFPDPNAPADPNAPPRTSSLSERDMGYGAGSSYSRCGASGF